MRAAAWRAASCWIASRRAASSRAASMRATSARAASIRTASARAASRRAASCLAVSASSACRARSRSAARRASSSAFASSSSACGCAASRAAGSAGFGASASCGRRRGGGFGSEIGRFAARRGTAAGVVAPWAGVSPRRSASSAGSAGSGTVKEGAADRSSAMTARPASASSPASTPCTGKRGASATRLAASARSRVGGSRPARLELTVTTVGRTFAVRGAWGRSVGDAAAGRASTDDVSVGAIAADSMARSARRSSVLASRTDSTVAGDAIAACVGTPRPGSPSPCSSNWRASSMRCTTTDPNSASANLRRSCRRSRLRHRVRVPMRRRRRRLGVSAAGTGTGGTVRLVVRAQRGVDPAAELEAAPRKRAIQSPKHSRARAGACTNHALPSATWRILLIVEDHPIFGGTVARGRRAKSAGGTASRRRQPRIAAVEVGAVSVGHDPSPALPTLRS